ncbi:unnamed protein product [Cuscuta campestris]|uniref:F-box domain-containing protein n=1 Tax=Cuscuta campestris TaxID=132261 RepID=A0A484KSL4_9ASTE|nr:unnamed protein product [Cuscuta campestris]
MKLVTVDADTQSLPEDIIRNILSRIPAKSLIQFQCVSKQWRTLIKTPSFVAENLCRQSPCLLFQGELCLLDCKMTLRKVRDPHLVSGLDSHRIMPSVNGLICLKISRTAFCVWNPAIGELRMAPKVIGPYKGHSNVGFGFGPIINDYKVVILWCDDFPCYAQVYSLTSGSWKVVECEILEGIRLYPEWTRPSVTAKGSIFWLGRKDDGDIIVSLELFTLIPVPVIADPVWWRRLVVYENKLALFIEHRLSENSKSIDLWVREEGNVASSSLGERWTWTKKYNTTLPRKVDPLTIWKNGIVCKVYEGWQVVKPRITLFNVTTGEFDAFVMHDCDKCIDYVESLVPVGEISCL